MVGRCRQRSVRHNPNFRQHIPGCSFPACANVQPVVKNLPLLQPFTDDEFARLAGFLDAIGTSAMNIETLDSYFAALICNPDMVLPSEYLLQIWGEDFSSDSNDQASGIVGLLMRHWNTIAAEWRSTLDEPNVYLPVLLEGTDGVAPGNDWAYGFMRGVQTHPESWSLLINDEDRGDPMLPIMMLHYEHDPAPEMRPPPIPSEKREELLQTVIAGLTQSTGTFSRTGEHLPTFRFPSHYAATDRRSGAIVHAAAAERTSNAALLAHRACTDQTTSTREILNVTRT